MKNCEFRTVGKFGSDGYSFTISKLQECETDTYWKCGSMITRSKSTAEHWEWLGYRVEKVTEKYYKNV